MPLDQARVGLDAEFHPDAYNIGINDGPAAGQTIGHRHIHLIPKSTVTMGRNTLFSCASCLRRATG